jgi:hypothetical protein
MFQNVASANFMAMEYKITSMSSMFSKYLLISLLEVELNWM